MRQIFRRNTVGDQPLSPNLQTLTGFGVPNKEEKLKKGPGYPWRERQRVKVIAPQAFLNKTGHIVELSNVLNQEGLMEIELDYELEDGTGFSKLSDPNIHRERLTIKNPDRQLIPYNYMRCQSQHFSSIIRADTLLSVGMIASLLCGIGIVCLLLGVLDREQQWNHIELFSVFLISQSLSVGMSFYCLLVAVFVGLSLKLNATKNKLIDNGDIQDDCYSYHWYKSTHFQPFWLRNKERSVIEYALEWAARLMLGSVACFILSIIFVIADHVESWMICICVVLIAGPSLIALHLIKNRKMASFAQ